MLYTLTETVIEYLPADYTAWKKGDKHKLLDGRVDVEPEVYNQPLFHFGEYFVLNYFEKALWRGFAFYTFFDSKLKKYQAGQNKLAELFPPDRLTAFRNARAQSKLSDVKGQPDIFLYMENGPKLFLEVKKGPDRVSKVQLEVLAQIRGILRAEIGIVYMVEQGRQHTPKRYELNLDTYDCSRL